jgi:hypothetical protein
MRLENQGLSLWYCTSDAPGPATVVPPGAEVPITAGVSPPDASNKIDVHYRTNGGTVASVSAAWFRNTSDAQYFMARLPAFQEGDQVECWVTARCITKCVPADSAADAAVFSFRVPAVESDASVSHLPAHGETTSRTFATGTPSASPTAAISNGNGGTSGQALLRASDVAADEPGLPSGTRVAAPVRAARAEGEGGNNNGNGGPGGGSIAGIGVSLDTPAAGLAVSGAEPGVAVDLTGDVVGEGVGDVRVRVLVGGTAFDASIVPGASDSEWQWHCPVRFYHPGQIPVHAVASGHTTGAGELRIDTSPQLTFAITLGSATPKFTIVRPEPGKRDVPVSEAAGAEIPLVVSASTGFGPRWVGWECEGQEGSLHEDPPGSFNGAVSLRPLPLGPRVVIVTCRDAGGNQATESVTLTALDNTPPRLTILGPPPYRSFIGGPDGVTVTVAGTAADGQSGMTGGAATVGWSLTAKGPYRPAAKTGADTNNPWATWTADVPVPDFGVFTIYTQATDRDGNSTTVSVPVQVISTYRPHDLSERLNPRSYLAALLASAREQVKVAGGSQLSSADLQAVFLQPFGKLSQPLSEIGDAGETPLAQLLVVAELLREFRETASSRLLAAHWSFDPAAITGGTVQDLSRNGNSATAVGGLVLEPGPAGGQAIRFDGTARYLQVANAPSLEVGANGTDFSVSFHIRPLQHPNGQWRSVMHKGAADQERTFAVWLHPDSNRLHARISTTVDWNEGLDSNAELPVDRWTHVAYVKAGTELRLFLDGRLDHTVIIKGQSAANTGPVYLGKDPWWPGLDGLLADVRILGFPLSAASAAVLAAAPGGATLAATLAAGEAAYRWAAYEAFLAGIGTSYEELRLARGADSGVRSALAARLGIRLTPGSPDELDQLTIDPASLTDPALEQLFGLRDTGVTQPNLRPSATALLLQWRQTALSLTWAEADHSPAAAGRVFRVLVDPDMIGPDDLAEHVVSNQALTLLTARTQELRQVREDLRLAREAGGPSPAAQMQALLQKGLPGADLLDVKSRQTAGEDIGPMLSTLMLTREGFEYLVRMVRLAAAGTVTDSEWQDAYDILTQVEKNRRCPQWRAQENAITLTPGYFRLSDSPPRLPKWRATQRARTDWERLLRSRIDDQDSTQQAYRSLIAAVEEDALPRLRDALVQSIAGAPVMDDVAEWLTERLQIDVKTSGVLRTTRIGQAIETLQSALFALRTGQLPADHPVHAWTLASQPGFDDAWGWLGTYEAWRAAMSVFLYPENNLQPALRPDSSEPFAALIRELRHRQHIGADDARRLSAAFFEAQLQDAHPGHLPPPAAHWAFDEGAGATAGDLGGSTGTLAGPRWTTGAIGTAALAFDGIDDRVSIHWSDALKNITNSFAMCLWASPDSPHEIDQEGGLTISGTSGQRYAYAPVQGQTAWGSADHAGVGVSVGTNGVSVYEHSAGYMPAVLVYEGPVSGWTHIAVVYDNRKPRLYINGSLARSSDTQSPKKSVHPAPDGLGGMGYGYFHGGLDDIRVYGGVLSPEQVELLSVRLSDQRTNTDLDLLWDQSQRLLAAPHTSHRPPYLQPGSEWLAELFCHVPLALALALQSSGEYTAALDWYQTVYAYNLRPQKREIYYALRLESNVPPDLTTAGDWTARLNPHVIARTRPNPYTRFVLMSLARCCIDFADAEFSRDTAESVAGARSLYLTARDLLGMPDLQPVIDPAATEWPLANPSLDALRGRIEVQLAKLRQGRTIAGIPRVIEPAAPTGLSALTQQTLPTPYRYRVLVERSRQLVTLTEQVEAAYLAALEKYDNAAFRRFDANKGVELSEAAVTLQGLRVTEAARGESLAQAQCNRASAVSTEYQRLIGAGLNQYENAMLDGYWNVKTLRDVIGGIDAAIGVAQVSMQAGDLFKFFTSAGTVVGSAVIAAAGHVGKAIAGGFLDAAEARLQSDTLLASHERAVEGWQLQKNIADQDRLVAAQQALVAGDQKAIADQEQKNAQTQAQLAKDTVEFLDRQFTNQELYEWISGELAGIYRYFLQQATALALTAQNQLAFERQEPPPALIRSDYWEPPANNAAVAGATVRDRRGLTGSARLLQDITQLDQHAFETDKRKLNLSQTFSLAQRAPLQFQLFRGTGDLQFVTPMQWFDEDFPGHYLRLIRRVSLTVVALIPPSQGIRATLTNLGISRAVVAGDVFREVVLRRDPETVALTSPLAATGVFDLDMQSEMLLPFESTGVDTTWQLQMPRAANLIDPDSFADVLITIEYTALHSDDYRHQMVERFNRDLRRGGDRAFSLRQDFPDQWYDLHNPLRPTDPRTIRLRLDPADFPSNITAPIADQLVLYLMGQNGAVDPVTVTLTHAGQSGVARSDKGVISTRRGNADAWKKNLGGTDTRGIWELAFPPEVGELFDNDGLKDVLFVIGYMGEVPRWPL